MTFFKFWIHSTVLFHELIQIKHFPPLANSVLLFNAKLHTTIEQINIFIAIRNGNQKVYRLLSAFQKYKVHKHAEQKRAFYLYTNN